MEYQAACQFCIAPESTVTVAYLLSYLPPRQMKIHFKGSTESLSSGNDAPRTPHLISSIHTLALLRVYRAEQGTSWAQPWRTGCHTLASSRSKP